MNETIQREPGVDGGETLEQAQALFHNWRESRRPGTKIPKALWGVAMRVAQRYGVAHTVLHLRVESQQLIKHIEDAGRAEIPEPPAVTFVAWPEAIPAAGAGITECVITCQNGHGQTMQVSLQGPGLHQLAPLCAAFWRAP